MTHHVYLDNAATTPLDPKVIDVMTQIYRDVYGNPSASHALGRQAKGILEGSRKKIADLLGAKSSEIYFNSGGTEGDNVALRTAVSDWGIKHIITSPIEHKAVIDTARDLENKQTAEVHLVRLHPDGSADLNHLKELVAKYPKSLVSLMHANNEIGTLNPLKEIADICHDQQCIFHSDTVQTMGHYAIHVNEIGIDLLTSSAHKFNGPKGVGFLYIRQPLKPGSMITGGGQEKNSRAGTENLPGIAGMAEALSICYEEMKDQHQHMQALKSYAIQLLSEKIPSIKFNGNIAPEGSLYTVLSLSLPPTPLKEMILFRLDIEGVCVSGGSACNSGAQKGSHVLMALNHPEDRMGIRMSFGKANTMEDIEFAVDKLTEILGAN
jgi:cysteine desulfurase